MKIRARYFELCKVKNIICTVLFIDFAPPKRYNFLKDNPFGRLIYVI